LLLPSDDHKQHAQSLLTLLINNKVSHTLCLHADHLNSAHNNDNYDAATHDNSERKQGAFITKSRTIKRPRLTFLNKIATDNNRPATRLEQSPHARRRSILSMPFYYRFSLRTSHSELPTGTSIIKNNTFAQSTCASRLSFFFKFPLGVESVTSSFVAKSRPT